MVQQRRGEEPITATDVMPLLLEACPSFDPIWHREVEEENKDDGSATGRLDYQDASDFIRHLVTLRLEGHTEEFAKVFETYDRLITLGDAYVRNLGVIGYLEGLQMMTVTSAGLDPERDFRPWLGPVSESWWARLNRFWSGEVGALTDPDTGTPTP